MTSLEATLFLFFTFGLFYLATTLLPLTFRFIHAIISPAVPNIIRLYMAGDIVMVGLCSRVAAMAIPSVPFCIPDSMGMVTL